MRGVEESMIDLIVDGLPDFVNTGDIVGAFTNEVKIDGSRIGKIRINRKRRRALVEIDEEVVQIVLQVMNEKQISGSDVKVSLRDYDEYLQMNLRNYSSKFKNLMYLERQEQLVRYRLEMRHLTGEEREKLGHALLKMRGRADSFPENDYYQVRFISQYGESALVKNKLSVGDLVIVSKDNPLAEGCPQGRVIQIEPTALTVEFKGEPAYYVYGRGLRIDLYGHDRIFQQTLKILKMLYLQDKSLSGRLKEILIGEEEPEWSGWNVEITDYGRLDEDQQLALYNSLKARDLLLIEGGAGTGKTALGAEIIRHHLERSSTVLAVGTSPKSRNLLAKQLKSRGLKVLVLGDVDLKTEPEYDEIYQDLLSVTELMKKRDELTHPGGQWMEGLTYKDILEKAGTTNRYAGIPGYRLKEMAEWIYLQREIDQLLNNVRYNQNKICTRLLSEHDILCITCDEAAHLNQKFGLVVIDDAHMITEPEILPAYFRGKKVILLGDRSQIRPGVESVEAREGKLDKSLFERFMEELDEEWICRLETQHRFNFSIWNCLNTFCSVGEKIEHLSSGASVDLGKWRAGVSGDILEDNASMIFLDTSRIEVEEIRDGDEYKNELETDLIREFIQTGVDLEKMSGKIGILTFYSAQMEMIKEALTVNQLEMDDIYPIDEFAGCERDLVIISLVHSNYCNYLGKIVNLPHLITAITRAREKCVIIGNYKILIQHPIYKTLIERIHLKGKVYTL